MTASISTDVIAISALCFTIYLAKRNIVVNKYKNSIYISVSVVTVILTLLEMTTVLMGLSGNRNLVITNRIADIIGFTLSPVVPYMLLFFNKKNGKSIFDINFLSIPLYLNAFLCILSYKTGWIFFVNAENQYIRGNVFLIPMIICMFYFILLVIEVIKSNVEYEKDDRKVLFLVFCTPVIGAVFQIIFKEVLLIWGTISISLLLYYIFLRELQFKYDVQTGIKNRSAFEKEMEQCIKGDNNVTIVILDINDLKSYNDKYGHEVGDEIIVHAANIVRESFMDIGKEYRIGGDEFCVICKDKQIELVDSALSNLENLLAIINQNRDIKIALAYGYAWYTKNESESIYSVFAKADKAMYEHKAKLKGL